MKSSIILFVTLCAIAIAPSTMALEITHFRTPSPAALMGNIPITDNKVDNPPIQRKVVASLAIGDLKAGDIVQAHASMSFTNDVNYLVMIGTKLVLSDDNNTPTGTSIGGIGNQNVDHYLVHHIAIPIGGSMEITEDINNAHLKYVAYGYSGLKSTDAGGGIPVYVPPNLPAKREPVIYPIAQKGHPTWGEVSNNIITIAAGGGFISATVIRR